MTDKPPDLVGEGIEGVGSEEFEEYARKLAIARAEQVHIETRTVDGKEVIWAPQEGSQETFMSCPLMECLLHGNRGGGKTDGLLMSYAQYVGRGFGEAWRGVIFRQTYPQLADIVAKSEKWFRLIFPEAEFNRANMYWKWPTGERLYFRHMARKEDYWHYHGHEYCVGEDTLVRVPGGVRPIKELVVGDLVETPIGARRVTRVINPGPKPCVRMSVYSLGGDLVGEQFQSVDHRILTRGRAASSGLCDSYGSVPLFSSDSILLRSGSRSHLGEAVETRFGSGSRVDRGTSARMSRRGFQSEPADLFEEQLRELSEQLFWWDALDLPGSSIQRHAGEGFSLLSRGHREGILAILLDQAPPQEQRQLLLAGSGSSHEASCDQLLSHRAPGSSAGYPFDLDFCDGLVHMDRGIDRCEIPSRHDARGPSHSLPLGVLGDELARTLQDQFVFPHPYTDRPLRSSQQPSFGYCSLEPCDPVALVDIEVEGANCYITHSGVANKNCFIGFEELTNWHNDECYTSMFSCCRSPNPDVPRMVRSTTNPYGPGHNWVKHRFRLDGQWWKTIVITDAVDLEGEPEPPRCSIHSDMSENKILMAADPDYRKTIRAAAGNEAMAEAWLNGSWDFVAGGMFDDVWDHARNIVPDFDIPVTWRIDRSFDWGSSHPFSVGWWAQSDGSDLLLKDGRVVSTVRGDMFRVNEWYGWTGKPNQGLKMLAVDVAKGIVERELMWGWRNAKSGDCIVKAGPADTSIFTVENGMCIAEDMKKPVRIGSLMYKGVNWTAADKRPGSRKLGWEMMRKMIRNAKSTDGGPREAPGLFIREGHCDQFLRTVLSLPRDERDLDDVDCFVAGTMVETPDGLRPIESFGVGDLVSTPIGARHVLKSYLSGMSKTVRVELSNGGVIEGTPDHKIYVDGVGLVPLLDLGVGYELSHRFLGEEFDDRLLRELNIREEIVSSLVEGSELEFAKKEKSPLIGKEFWSNCPYRTDPLSVVSKVESNTSKRVYNLTIEQAGLFVVAGVLCSNTDAEDHVGDEVRYRVRSVGTGISSGTTTGMY